MDLRGQVCSANLTGAEGCETAKGFGDLVGEFLGWDEYESGDSSCGVGGRDMRLAAENGLEDGEKVGSCFARAGFRACCIVAWLIMISNFRGDLLIPEFNIRTQDIFPS